MAKSCRSSATWTLETIVWCASPLPHLNLPHTSATHIPSGHPSQVHHSNAAMHLPLAAQVLLPSAILFPLRCISPSIKRRQNHSRTLSAWQPARTSGQGFASISYCKTHTNPSATRLLFTDGTLRPSKPQGCHLHDRSGQVSLLSLPQPATAGCLPPSEPCSIHQTLLVIIMASSSFPPPLRPRAIFCGIENPHTPALLT